MSDELYQFPSDHVGRKSYVSVRGHSKSVPKFKTYKGVDGRNYLLPEHGGNWDGAGNAATMVMPDIGEFVSPIDNSRISSRSHLRNHERMHGVVQVGNDVMRPRVEQAKMTSVGHDVKRAIEQLRSR